MELQALTLFAQVLKEAGVKEESLCIITAVHLLMMQIAYDAEVQDTSGCAPTVLGLFPCSTHAYFKSFNGYSMGQAKLGSCCLHE